MAMKYPTSYQPDRCDPAPVWSPWVASGANVEDRRRRLALVPEPIRSNVASHVRAVFELKARQKHRSRIGMPS